MKNMTQEDKDFLKSIEHNKEFHDTLIKCFPEGIPQRIKDAVNRGYLEPYDAGQTCDELNGHTEYPD